MTPRKMEVYVETSRSRTETTITTSLSHKELHERGVRVLCRLFATAPVTSSGVDNDSDEQIVVGFIIKNDNLSPYDELHLWAQILNALERA